MGHRANLIVIAAGGYDLYYSHWAANTLPRDLFWGPGHALAFARAQRPVGPDDGWLDDVWAEGGAVIDPAAHVLRLFGGEDLQYDVPLRRLYLTLLAAVWDGWDVGWAHEGIADLADYVGLPRERVLSGRADEPRPPDLGPPQERDWVDLVGSVRLHSGAARLFPLAGNAPGYLFAGPALADAAAAAPGYDRLRLGDWTASFPTGGFHLDVSLRAVWFWDARDQPGVAARLAARWPGWSVGWGRDHYETQLAAVDGALSFPERPADALLADLTAVLLAEPGRSPAETVLWFADRERAAGKAVEVNPLALCDDRVEAPEEAKADVLARAVARLGLRPRAGAGP